MAQVPIQRVGPWLGVAIILGLTACGSRDLLGLGAVNGIDGIVLSGPQCPIQTSGNPCLDLPYQAWIEVRTAEGASVTRIRSGEDGRFRVGLRPALCVLDPESGNPFPVASEMEVAVQGGVFIEVTVSFDTGLR